MTDKNRKTTVDYKSYLVSCTCLLPVYCFVIEYKKIENFRTKVTNVTSAVVKTSQWSVTNAENPENTVNGQIFAAILISVCSRSIFFREIKATAIILQFYKYKSHIRVAGFLVHAVSAK